MEINQRLPAAFNGENEEGNHVINNFYDSWHVGRVMAVDSVEEVFRGKRI